MHMLSLRRCRSALAACALMTAVSPVVAAEPAAVPLKKVVLFNSGVGFFEHRAEVDGDARVDLKFNVDDVNDLLKSMVLQDLGGGRISTVNYGSKDPITRTLRTFAIDLTSNPTLGDLLGQIRGEKVQIDAPNQVVGVIVGVEKRLQPSGRDQQPNEAEFLNLLTDDGLRSVPLATVGRIKLVNEKLDGELRQALTILALGHATDKKTVTLNFLGQGKRPVRVGYVQEAPIWKTSYRLVLSDDEAPFLQGWAIVENTTEEDWKQVALTLVSGRPISFVMDLYQPLYVARPVVEPELFASLRPQTYGQDMANREQEFRKLAEAEGEAGKRLAGRARGGMPGGGGFGGGGMGGGLGGGGPAGFMEGGLGTPPAKPQAKMNIAEGVQSVAQAADIGELFQYAIESPVDLPRQQSAMIPIVNGSVQGKKVSIYNAAVHAKHPLNGLKMTNGTGLHLMQGPITVFDDNSYAGDAQIQDLPPGTERLISYALDLDTEVAPTAKTAPDELVSVKIAKGVLTATRKYVRSQQYVVKNSGKKAKDVLIEQAHDPAWTLTAPKEPAEKTRDLYRFALTAEPGKPATLAVEETRTMGQQIALSNLDDASIRLYLSAKVVSEDVKKALSEIVRRKQQLGQLATRKQALEGQSQTIDQEQARVRQNMAQLERNTDLYNRYVKKFGEQEDQVEKLRADIAKLNEELTAASKSLDDYMLGLNSS